MPFQAGSHDGAPAWRKRAASFFDELIFNDCPPGPFPLFLPRLFWKVNPVLAAIIQRPGNDRQITSRHQFQRQFSEIAAPGAKRSCGRLEALEPP